MIHALVAAINNLAPKAKGAGLRANKRAKLVLYLVYLTSRGSLLSYRAGRTGSLHNPTTQYPPLFKETKTFHELNLFMNPIGTLDYYRNTKLKKI